MYGQSADRVNPMVQHLSRNTHHPSPAELGSPHYRSSGRHSFIEQPTRDTAITQTGADKWVTQKLHPWQPLLLTITSKNPGPAPPSFPFPPAIRGLSNPHFLHGLLSTAGAELSSSRAAPNPKSWALLQAWSKLLPPHLPSSSDEINCGFLLLVPSETPLVGTGVLPISICYLFAQISPGTLPLLSPCLGFPFCLSNFPSYWSDPAPRAGGLHPHLLITDSCNRCTACQWPAKIKCRLSGTDISCSPQPCEEWLSRSHKSRNHV